jgi:hypothetical protein
MRLQTFWIPGVAENDASLGANGEPATSYSFFSETTIALGVDRI